MASISLTNLASFHSTEFCETINTSMFALCFLPPFLSACFALKDVNFDFVDFPLQKWVAADKLNFTANSTAECGLRCTAKSNPDQFFCSGFVFLGSEKACTLAELVYFPEKLRVAWASSEYTSNTFAWRAIDNEYKTGSWILQNIFHSHKEKHPWYAVDMIYEHEVHGIEIVERKDDAAWRTKDIEVRVGHLRPFEAGEKGDVKYTINDICGVFKGPGSTGGISTINCCEPIRGRYVTLQRVSDILEYLNWSEIRIQSSILKESVEGDVKIMKRREGFALSPKCPSTDNFSQCPKSHPFAYHQGDHCCKLNIEHDTRMTSYPILHFDSRSCKDDHGVEKHVACSKPPCINNGCRLYKCYLQNKELTGSKINPLLMVNFQST